MANKPDTFKEWMRSKFEDVELEDIQNHGVDAGFSGLIYYSECVKLYEQYEDEIWKLAADTAEEYARELVPV